MLGMESLYAHDTEKINALHLKKISNSHFEKISL